MNELFLMAGCIARNGHISTSDLKYDVTIVFLDPHLLKDAKFSAIRGRYKIIINICMDFQNLLA